MCKASIANRRQKEIQVFEIGQSFQVLHSRIGDGRRLDIKRTQRFQLADVRQTGVRNVRASEVTRAEIPNVNQMRQAFVSIARPR